MFLPKGGGPAAQAQNVSGQVMKTIGLMTAVLVLAAVEAFGQPVCTREAAAAAQTEAARLTTWASLYSSFRAYGQCDDGAIAEGYTESVMKLLTEEWSSISKLAPLWSHADFRSFIKRHMNETYSKQAAETALDNTTRQCPIEHRIICDELMRAIQPAAARVRAERATLADPALLRLAQKSGCNGGPVEYVPGYFLPADTSSGVFWCRRAGKSYEEGRFLIVIVDRRGNQRHTCPPAVTSINQPKRLRILREEKIPLEWFADRDKPSVAGPSGQYAASPIIDTGDDGAGEQWVCHKGRWLVRVYH